MIIICFVNNLANIEKGGFGGFERHFVKSILRHTTCLSSLPLGGFVISKLRNIPQKTIC